MTYTPPTVVLLATGLAILSAPTTASAATSAMTEIAKPAPRLVVSYAKQGKLGVFDLRTGKRAGTVSLPARDAAFLSVVDDRRHVVAVQHHGDEVRVLDGGSWTVPHGDHAHSYIAAPRLTPFRLSGPAPSHVVFDDATVAIHLDGAAKTNIFAARDLAKAAQPRRTFTTGKAHHGVAVPFGPITLASTAAAAPELEDDGLPGEISVRDGSGNETGRLAPCPELHGETAGKGWAAFACSDGVLLATVSGLQVTSSKIPYPAGTPAGQRAFTLRASSGDRHLLADFGEKALLRVDRVVGTLAAVPLPADRGPFTVDGPNAFVVTGDGRLRQITVATGRLVRTARAIRPYDTATRKPRPQIAVGAERTIISEPATGSVHVLSSRTLGPLRTIKPGGTPGQLAVTGAGPPST